MALVTGIYKIPALKHIFFIMPDLPADLCIEEQGMRDSRIEETRGYFERIILDKHNMQPTLDEPWTIKSIYEEDILSVLQSNTTRITKQTLQSSDESLEMQFLSINISKKLKQDIKSSLETHTEISRIPDKDLIEVSI